MKLCGVSMTLRSCRLPWRVACALHLTSGLPCCMETSLTSPTCSLSSIRCVSLGVLLKLNTLFFVKLGFQNLGLLFAFFFFNSCRPQHLLPRVFRNSPLLSRELEIQLISTGCVPTLSCSQTLIPAQVSNDWPSASEVF